MQQLKWSGQYFFVLQIFLIKDNIQNMQLEIDAILKKQQDELDEINHQLQVRSQKFGSEFIPLTIADYKLFKIRKASETGNIQYLENILLSDIQDMQQRKRKIQERSQKFFPDVKIESDPNKFFNERQVPDFTSDQTIIRYNTWYLFGVDYMSNEKIRNYFNSHFRIQWINDSSCNISFKTKEEAEQAVRPHIKGNQMSDEKDEIWYELQEYEIQGVKRKLFCRLATNKDAKQKEQHGHQSKYYRWQINKQKVTKIVKKRAQQQINKTKPIKRQNTKRTVKKQEESSSGFDSSEGENDNAMKEGENGNAMKQGENDNDMKE